MSLIRIDLCRVFKSPWLYVAMLLCLLTPKAEDGTVIMLPFVGALPMSSAVYLELETKVAHTAIFKTSRRAYIASKCLQLLTSGFLVGLVSFELSRILGCMVFAFLGGIFGMITQDVACVLGVPCAASFGLWLLAKKFFGSSPIHLYSGDYLLPFSVAVIIVLVSFCLTLYEKVKIDVL